MDKPYAGLPGEKLRLDAFIEMLQNWKTNLRGTGAEDLNPEVRFMRPINGNAKCSIVMKMHRSERERDHRNMATIDFILSDNG